MVNENYLLWLMVMITVRLTYIKRSDTWNIHKDILRKIVKFTEGENKYADHKC